MTDHGGTFDSFLRQRKLEEERRREGVRNTIARDRDEMLARFAEIRTARIDALADGLAARRADRRAERLDAARAAFAALPRTRTARHTPRWRPVTGPVTAAAGRVGEIIRTGRYRGLSVMGHLVDQDGQLWTRLGPVTDVRR